MKKIKNHKHHLKISIRFRSLSEDMILNMDNAHAPLCRCWLSITCIVIMPTKEYKINMKFHNPSYKSSMESVKSSCLIVAAFVLAYPTHLNWTYTASISKLSIPIKHTPGCVHWAARRLTKIVYLNLWFSKDAANKRKLYVCYECDVFSH